jgi:cytidylate kinase
MTERAPVITLDGPSGTGKGTLCHLLASHLGWHCLDSGAIYRVFALAAAREQIVPQDYDALLQLARRLPLRFSESQVYLNDEIVTDTIRTEQCGQAASKMAENGLIREALLARQRAFAVPPGLVTDGRDMGTVVFPEAELKIYLSASAETRAMRRYLQLKKNGKSDTLAHVADELAQRDARDTARTSAPLKPALDAIVLDTTGLSIEHVFEQVMQAVKHRRLS